MSNLELQSEAWRLLGNPEYTLEFLQATIPNWSLLSTTEQYAEINKLEADEEQLEIIICDWIIFTLGSFK